MESMETFDIVTNCVTTTASSKRNEKRKLAKKVTFSEETNIAGGGGGGDEDDNNNDDDEKDNKDDGTPEKQRRCSPRLLGRSNQPIQQQRCRRPRQSSKDETSESSSSSSSMLPITATVIDPKSPKRVTTSSIFTKNPEIPTIKTKTGKEIEEVVFGSKTFSSVGIHPYLVSNLRQSFSIERLTVVQELTIPAILGCRDVLIKSQTGSGKTLAYAVPIVDILQSIEPKVKRDSGIYGVIVVPTRELAVQTYEWFHTLLKSFNRIVVSCFMGGQKRKSEKACLRRGVNLLVTTPQRFLDHLQNSQQLNVSNVRWLVLDEADRLTDMGYERDVGCIVKALKQELVEEGQGGTVQVIMASATLSEGVERLAGLSLASPVVIDCAVETNATEKPHQLVTPVNLRQHFLVTPVKLRLVTLAAFVLWKCRGDRHKLLVFLPTQDMVDFHAKLFKHIVNAEQDCSDDVTIDHLHGNMSQHERTEVFKSFRDAESGVLLCTDVASRGLDLPRVHWIVQYSAPTSAADYVHRVGRTARIGVEGNALLFLLPSETAYVRHLEDNGINVHQMTVESILDALPRVQTGGKSKVVLKSAEEAATSLQVTCETAVKSQAPLATAARNAFQSYVRFYSTYPANLRTIFPFKELHLGHVAKSMALLETPSTLGTFRRPTNSATASSYFRPGPKAGSDHRQSNVTIHNPMKLMLQEYESGI